MRLDPGALMKSSYLLAKGSLNSKFRPRLVTIFSCLTQHFG